MEPVSIIIPVYNEGENIDRNLRQIAAEVEVPYTITIVYDFDEDDTLPVARRTAEALDLPLRLQQNIYGRGALNAIKTGLHTCETRFMVVTMADLSDPPAVINQMAALAEEQDADIVCGSRYMRGGAQIGGPPLKTLLSRLAGTSLYHLTSLPTHDATNSFKLYSKRLIDAVEIESSGGFELGIELVVKAHFQGYKVLQVPTTWTDRSAGESRFKLFSWLPNYLRWYVYALKHQARGR